MSGWFQLTPKQQEDIKKLYKELSGKDFKEPKEIESSAELEKLMKKPTRWKKRPK